jgi:hypothetical protein
MENAKFRNQLVAAFMDVIQHPELKQLPDAEYGEFDNSHRRVVDLEYYRRIEITGAAGRTDVLKQDDLHSDGLNLFAIGATIPVGGSIMVGSIFIGHAFNASAETSAVIASAEYNNLIPYYQSNTNAAAGTACSITQLRDDATSISRVPKELLAADLIITANGVEFFRKNVRKMFFDSRVNGLQDTGKGYKLEVPYLLASGTQVGIQLLFPSGVTVPGTAGSGNVYHFLEVNLIGVGSKVKAA